ncbi:TadE family protein [Bariatricus sp. SGI.154]|uniref:TadE family protein n=1 Tax=Bariatricus sp. SGI.154 TaxID=3420549 RepID=UPI003D06C4A5
MSKQVRKRSVHGSMTIEMSFLMPMILFLTMGCILAVFYYHDKNILSGAAYETVVVGSTKAREKDGVEAGELESLLSQRVRNKCILFSYPRVVVTVEDKEIEIVVSAKRKWMKVSIVKRAAVTEPERYIRNIRRLKK